MKRKTKSNPSQRVHPEEVEDNTVKPKSPITTNEQAKIHNKRRRCHQDTKYTRTSKQDRINSMTITKVIPIDKELIKKKNND